MQCGQTVSKANRKVVKIIKRPQPTECDVKENVVLIKVKRTAQMREDIEELQLEFAEGGSVKRQKLLTQNEVLVRNFNESLSSITSQQKAVGFSLGLPSKPVVRLTRLMGANEEDLRRQAQVKLIEKTRQTK